MLLSGSQMSTKPVDLPVLIVAFRAPDLLERCLHSVKTFHTGQDVLIWDNTGTGTSEIRELARRHTEFQWHFSDRNIGFAAAVNRLADMIPGRDFLLLNPDAELVAPLEKTLALIRQPGVAAAGPMIADEDFGAPVLRTRQVSRLSREMTPWDVANRRIGLWQVIPAAAGLGRIRDTPFSSKYRAPRENVSGYIFGSCLAIRRKTWDQLGGFDEEFFLYGEEKEWQYRAVKSGWTIRLAGDCAAKHVGRGTVVHDRELRRRSEDLQFANGILCLERIHGEPAAEIYLAWVSLLARLKRRVRRTKSPNNALGDVVVTAFGPTHVITNRIATAIELEQAGHRVVVVSLQALGILQSELPPSIRLIRMAWWWPWPPDGKLPTFVVSGETRRERVFGQLLRLQRETSIQRATDFPKPIPPVAGRQLAVSAPPARSVTSRSGLNWPETGGRRE
jgi:GT2 family glycosyltransferase